MNVIEEHPFFADIHEYSGLQGFDTVRSIHGDTKRHLAAYLGLDATSEQARASSGGPIVLQSPAAGYGKTCLLDQLTSSHPDQFSVVRVTSASQFTNLRDDAPRELVLRVCLDHAEDGCAPIFSIARSFLSQQTQLDLNPLFQEHGTTKLLTPSGSSTLSLSDGQKRFWSEFFFRLLQKPAAADLRAIRRSLLALSEEESFQLLRLVDHYSRILLIFDPLDFVYGAARMAFEVVDLALQLGDQAITSIISVNADVWEKSFETTLPEAWLDLLGYRSVHLRSISTDDAVEMVNSRLSDYDADKVPERFVERFKEEAEKQGVLYPRAVLRLASAVWDTPPFAPVEIAPERAPDGEEATDKQIATAEVEACAPHSTTAPKEAPSTPAKNISVSVSTGGQTAGKAILPKSTATHLSAQDDGASLQTEALTQLDEAITEGVPETPDTERPAAPETDLPEHEVSDQPAIKQVQPESQTMPAKKSFAPSAFAITEPVAERSELSLPSPSEAKRLLAGSPLDALSWLEVDETPKSLPGSSQLVESIVPSFGDPYPRDPSADFSPTDDSPVPEVSVDEEEAATTDETAETPTMTTSADTATESMNQNGEQTVDGLIEDILDSGFSVVSRNGASTIEAPSIEETEPIDSLPALTELEEPQPEAAQPAPPASEVESSPEPLKPDPSPIAVPLPAPVVQNLSEEISIQASSPSEQFEVAIDDVAMTSFDGSASTASDPVLGGEDSLIAGSLTIKPSEPESPAKDVPESKSTPGLIDHTPDNGNPERLNSNDLEELFSKIGKFHPALAQSEEHYPSSQKVCLRWQARGSSSLIGFEPSENVFFWNNLLQQSLSSNRREKIVALSHPDFLFDPELFSSFGFSPSVTSSRIDIVELTTSDVDGLCELQRLFQQEVVDDVAVQAALLRIDPLLKRITAPLT